MNEGNLRFKSGRNHWKALGRFVPYLWQPDRPRYRFFVLLALGSLVLAKIAGVLTPILFKYMVDNVGPDNAGPGPAAAAAGATLVIGLVIAYGLARVLTVIFEELREWSFAPVAQNAIRQASLEAFRHLHRLSMRFHLDRKTGGVARVIERGSKGIDFILTFTLFNIVPTLLEILIIGGILWSFFNFWFALVTVSTIVLYILFTLMSTEWRLKYRREMNEQDTKANSHAVDSLLNFETVKYFGNEAWEAERYDMAMRRYEKASVRSIQSLSVVNVGQGFIISGGLVILLWMATRGVQNGTMTLGDFVLVNSYLLQLYMPLSFLGFVYRQIRQSLTDMDEMLSLLSEQPDILDKTSPEPLASPSGVAAAAGEAAERTPSPSVFFENVFFAYDARRPILQNFNLEVLSGQAVAIVGPSGAGKSTLSRLLFRFYDVTRGSVQIDGLDIRDMPQSHLRKLVGIVPQDTVLFNESIRYNVAYGCPSASSEAIEHAVKAAHLSQFVDSLPEGLETEVGERGLKLSGGEKQRVAIARTILKNPPILVFDEATSALDTATEQEIQRELELVAKGRTSLIIAHRLSTVVNADKIIVLDRGAIREHGTHQALLEQPDGLYRAMWERQQKARQDARDTQEHAFQPLAT